MEVRDLRYFIAVAELGQLHIAAEHVGRSQPALSKCIRRLEDEIGARLFQRAGRGIQMTAVGKALLVRARRISQTMDEALSEVKETACGDVGHVRIGTAPSTAEWLLPGLFRRVLAESPDLTFDIVTGLGGVLRRSLIEGKLDLVLGPLLETDDSQFRVVKLSADVMVVAAREGHPLASSVVRPIDLLTYKWLLPSQAMSSTMWIWHQFALRELPQPDVQVAVDTVMPLRRVVAQTDLLTFLSRRDLNGGEGARLHALNIRELDRHRSFGALCLTNHYVSPATERLLQRLQLEGNAILEEVVG